MRIARPRMIATGPSVSRTAPRRLRLRGRGARAHPRLRTERCPPRKNTTWSCAAVEWPARGGQIMGDRLKLIGMHVARYGLVIVLLWIGGMKFTAYEAEGIKPLVANSPLMGWVYRVMSVGGFSALLGVVEIAIGVLIALRPGWPMGSAVGSGLAAGGVFAPLRLPVPPPRGGPGPGGVPPPSA